MQTIDLASILEKSEVSKKELAKLLFPSHKYPGLAINNVLKGELKLDSEQISKLSSFTGISIEDLFQISKWKMESLKGQIEFSNGEFKALLNTETWITKIFCNDSMFHESVIHAGTIPLSEYIKQINELISKHKENEQN